MHRRQLGSVAVVAAVVGGLLAAGVVGAGAAPAPSSTPTVTGPITGGKGRINLTAPGVQVAPGYEGQEYVLSGTATSYQPTKKLGSDGTWTVVPSGTAPYRTRIVVYRPADASAFNGTVFVEWLNVSAGFESAPDWGSGHTAIARSGAAWVGVSAQSVGVQGGQKAIAGVPSGGLKVADPARYGSLSHPGVAYSYDIFTQAGLAAKGKTELNPMAGLTVKRAIALGESQSAFRMVTYVNAVQPIAGVYDGFLIHSRSAGAAGFGASKTLGLGDRGTPKVVKIRKTKVPVLTLQTETDLVLLGSVPSRQADTNRFRLWEVAGSAHADAYTGLLGFNDTGDGSTELTLLDPTKADGGPLQCGGPINSGPGFAVLDAALVRLDRWVRGGAPPARAARLALAPGAKVRLVRDRNGNAKGGVRTPLVDVPVATLSGEKNRGGTFCAVFGNTIPFDATKLRALYPTNADYVKVFDRSAAKAVAAGFLLPTEAEHFKAAARQIAVPPPAG